MPANKTVDNRTFTHQLRHRDLISTRLNKQTVFPLYLILFFVTESSLNVRLAICVNCAKTLAWSADQPTLRYY
jgi:hypothetical protein